MKRLSPMIPPQLCNERFRFILLKPRDKVPFEKEWQLKPYCFNDARLLQGLERGCNYGVATGHGSLLVLDFDNRNVQEKVLPQLPETFAVKTGKGGLHLYFISDNCRSSKITDAEGKTLVDIQGNGKQVVGAGSTHPNGNKYEVAQDLPITTIKRASIDKVFQPFLLKPQATSIKHTIKAKGGQLQHLRNICERHGIKVNAQDMACCPFHPDTQPSLKLYDNGWHCFGCHRSGSIYGLLKGLVSK